MPSGKDALTLQAPAKINLFLEVLGKRADGFHELRSLLTPISLCDEVRLEKHDGDTVETQPVDGGVPEAASVRCLAGGPDLAARAGMALKALTGYRGGARITLVKRIPIGGGLGGGSADAAAALCGLNALWGTGLSTEELARLGATVGCDVPALVHGRLVLVEGVGDRVRPLPRAGQGGARGGCCVLLVNPGFSISTADVYARWNRPLTPDAKSVNEIISWLENGDVERAGRCLRNDLQAVVFRKYPLVAMLVETMERAGALGALLSGSGASVFCLARDESHARQIGASVSAAFGGAVWSRIVWTMPDGVIGSTRPFGGLSLGSSPSRAAMDAAERVEAI